MRALRRRRVIVPAAAAVVVLVVVTGAAWSLLSDGRRMGSTVERMLVRRTGLPIAVGAASWNGRRLRLRDVHLMPAPGLPLDVRARELTIAAGILVLVAPAGRAVAVTIPVASITRAGASATDGNDIESLRRLVLSLLAWPGVVTLRAERAELRTAAGIVTLDLTAEKQGPGLTLALTTPPAPRGDALRVDVRSAPALGRALDLVVDLAGSSRAVAAAWPGAASLASPVSARVQLQLLAGGVVSSFGRLALGTTGAGQTTLEFTSRYDSTTGDLGISRYALGLGDDVRLSGTARLVREAGGRRLSARGSGTAAGSAVSATGSWDPASGIFETDVRLSGPDAPRVVQRLGIPAVQASGRDIHTRVSGRAEMTTMTVRVDAPTSHAPTAR
jgi:hypothetical protein